MRFLVSSTAIFDKPVKFPPGRLVLQLHFVPAAVVSLFSVGLVPSAPERPCHDEGGSGGAREQETRQEITDFGHRRKQRSPGWPPSGRPCSGRPRGGHIVRTCCFHVAEQ